MSIGSIIAYVYGESVPATLSNSRMHRMTLTERRHCRRVFADSTHVHLHVLGDSTRRCKVRCMSSDGIFIEPGMALQPGLRIELAYTCQYTRQIVRMYRRSAYVARVSDDGVALLFSDKHKSSSGS